MSELANLLLIIVLVFLNGFFVAAEFAILNSQPLKIKQQDEGRVKRSSRAAIWLIGKLDLSLTATQLGVTTSSILIGWLGVNALAQSLSDLLDVLNVAPKGVGITVLSAVVALVIIAFVHIVWGEIVARSIGTRFPEETLRVVSSPVVLFAQLVRPIVFVVTSCANSFLHLFGTSIPAKHEKWHSVSELSLLVTESTERGVLDKDEEKMLRGVFGFSDTIAREVMTPRTDLATIEVTASFEEIMRTVVDTGLSRFPVRGEEIDDILGVLLVKDLLACLAQNGTPPPGFSIHKIMREPYFIPGTKPIDDLLNEFKHRKVHMAIVLDEHGGVDGVVTLEDLIEEIVGDIFDESDIQEQSVVVEENGDVIAAGGTLVADLNERFSLSIPEGEYDTIAGFVFACLGRIAKVGDEIVLDENGHVRSRIEEGVERQIISLGENGSRITEGNGQNGEKYGLPNAVITVQMVENNRIETVRLHRLSAEYDPESSAESSASEDKGV